MVDARTSPARVLLYWRMEHECRISRTENRENPDSIRSNPFVSNLVTLRTSGFTRAFARHFYRDGPWEFIAPHADQNLKKQVLDQTWLPPEQGRGSANDGRRVISSFCDVTVMGKQSGASQRHFGRSSQLGGAKAQAARTQRKNLNNAARGFDAIQ